MVYAVESPSYTYEGYYAVPTNPKQVPQATAKAAVQATTQGTFQTMYARPAHLSSALWLKIAQKVSLSNICERSEHNQLLKN